MKIEEDYSELLEGMNEAVEAEAQKAANILREKYVIPFCDEYRFRFTSGMGTSFFTRLEDDKIVYPLLTEDIDRHCDEIEVSDEVRERTQEINGLLWTMTFDILGEGPLGNHFGWDSWIDDYNPEDPKC